MTGAREVLASTRSVLLIDYPGRAVPEAFARAGFETSAHEGPDEDEYYAYARDNLGEVVRSKTGAPPAHVDLVYTYRPVDELVEIVVFARERGANAVWFGEAHAEHAREIVEDAGLVYVDDPDVVGVLG